MSKVKDKYYNEMAAECLRELLPHPRKCLRDEVNRLAGLVLSQINTGNLPLDARTERAVRKVCGYIRFYWTATNGPSQKKGDSLVLARHIEVLRNAVRRLRKIAHLLPDY